MKKKVLLLLSIAFGAVAMAQLNTLVEQSVPVGDSYVSNVAYAEVNGLNFAVYSTAEKELFRIVWFSPYYSTTVLPPSGSFSSAVYFPVDQECKISDVCVLGDVVYFCGKRNMGGRL